MFYVSNNKKFCFAFILWVFPCCSFALETVELQLRWHHQFQFAGYYAAVEQGFYRDVGLNVILTEGQPDKKPVTQVLKGQATYGVGNSEVLLNRLQGVPLVALAAVFQHSPSVLIARTDSNISSPHDLIAKKVMLMGEQVGEGHVDADFVAMLYNENIDIKKIDFIPSSYQVQDLIDGKTDVFNAYLSNEPYYLKQRNVDYTILSPRNYGVDFYSDILFTTETELVNHPQRVKDFREASLKGWRYALDHQQEIIDLLMSQYTTEKTEEHLVFEAEAVKGLVLPNVVELGHMNPWRWQHMARTFIDASMVDDDHFLEGFNYQQLMLQKQSKWIQIGKFAVLTSFVVILILIVLTFAYIRTKQEIKLRLKAEDSLKEIAYTDSLTSLDNRHQFFILGEQSLKQAKRNRSSVALCYIDVNNFKNFNDNYGHHVGDLILVNLANVLRKITRESDIIARVGGDEFIVIFENISTRDEAEQLLLNMKQHIEKPIPFDGHHFITTVSIGLGLYPDEAATLDELLKVADGKMYAAKKVQAAKTLI